MKYHKISLFFIFVICGVVLAACGNTHTGGEKIQPISLEEIDETRNRLILTERAAQRLDIQTAPVSETMMEEMTYLVVPYSTIIYDLTGGVWVYVNPAPLTYQREQVVVETIDGDSVLLSEGPPAGTMVVTIGVPELYGADTGVGK
jgi:predicted small secreted protein